MLLLYNRKLCFMSLLPCQCHVVPCHSTDTLFVMHVYTYTYTYTYTYRDPDGISPDVWRYMMEHFGVKSLLDVACGRGFSTSWFFLQGVDAMCVEGSYDAHSRNLLPDLVRKKGKEQDGKGKGKGKISEEEIEVEVSKRLVQHDFSMGPWWPEDTVDAVWCVELL